jgi:hypothetical protein
MKKPIALFLFLLTGMPLFAQKGMYVGLQFIPQKSILFNKDDLRKNKAFPEKDLSFLTPTNFNSGGIVLGYAFTKHWGLELNFISSYQGQKYSGIMENSANPSTYTSLVALQASLANENIKGEAFEANVQLHYLKIPLMFRFTSDNSKRIYASIHAGPQVNILRSATHKLNGIVHGYPGTGVETEDLYKKLTLDGVFALGIGLNLLKYFTISAQVRGDFGFQDMERKNKTYSYEGSTYRFFGPGRSDTRNGSLGVSLGLNYKLLK